MVEGIIISDGFAWYPTRKWIAQNVSGYIEHALPIRRNSDVLVAFKEAMSSRSWCSVDLTTTPSDDYAVFFKATRLGNHFAKSAGRKTWYEPSSFSEFIREFDRLLVGMVNDVRAEGVECDLSFRHRFDTLQELLAKYRRWQRGESDGIDD